MRRPLVRLVASGLVAAGLACLVVAVVLYVLARDDQAERQAALDRRWSEEQRQAQLRHPGLLPGAKPAPAALEGLLAVVGLGAFGAAEVVAGALILLAGAFRRADDKPA